MLVLEGSRLAGCGAVKDRTHTRHRGMALVPDLTPKIANSANRTSRIRMRWPTLASDGDGPMTRLASRARTRAASVTPSIGWLPDESGNAEARTKPISQDKDGQNTQQASGNESTRSASSGCRGRPRATTRRELGLQCGWLNAHCSRVHDWTECRRDPM